VALVYAVPLEKRPKIQGAYGALFGLSSIVGPIIGGAFTSHASWRWCFYINLPIGAVAVVAICLFLKIPHRETEKLPLTEKLLQLDIPGTICLVPAIVCLVLALQWGGQKYPVGYSLSPRLLRPFVNSLQWSNGRVVALLTVMGVLTVAFVAIQILLPKTALAPPRIFTQRSILAGWWQTLMIGASQYIVSTTLLLWTDIIS
jgi:MFS family permease